METFIDQLPSPQFRKNVSQIFVRLQLLDCIGGGSALDLPVYVKLDLAESSTRTRDILESTSESRLATSAQVTASLSSRLDISTDANRRKMYQQSSLCFGRDASLQEPKLVREMKFIKPCTILSAAHFPAVLPRQPLAAEPRRY